MKTDAETKKIKNFCKKIWKFENNAYLCSPVRKTGNNKFIEKTD